jgi:pseudouridylate synthase
LNPILSINEEVKDALRSGDPVVALESTIIAHGMPFPQNLETAIAVEKAVRENGAIPATIAVINGLPTVGLSVEQLEELSQAAGVLKLSRRDLAFAVSQGKTGATTVATTMIIASLAGIELFATGGIGGVHRGVKDSWDVSADITELARTNVAVVCAGAKSILDIPKTLEILETHGVPVVGYQCDEFPAFYCRTSGSMVDFRLDSPKEISDLWFSKKRLGLNGGVLIANPVPQENSLDPEVMDAAIAEAITRSEAAGISGKELTPFLLSIVKELTQGESLVSNIALVLNNAELAAQIAASMPSRSRAVNPSM